MAGRLKSFLGTALRIALSAGLLGLLGYLFRDKLGDSLALIGRARPGWLALAAGWYAVFVLVSSWRWQILLAARGMRFSTWYLARVFTISLFFCKLLPTSIGGDVFRIAYTAGEGRTADAFSATLLDRLIGFTSLMFLAVVVALGLFLFSPSARALELALGGVALRGPAILGLLCAGLAALVLVTLAFFSDTAHRLANRAFGRVRLARLGERLDKAFAAVKSYRRARWALGLSFLSGIAVQATLALSWHATAAAIGGTVPVVYYLVFIPLLNVVVNIPTIGGLGVREWAYVLFFTPAWLSGHLTGELALASALLFLALDLVFALSGGVLFAVTRRGNFAAAGNPETQSAAGGKEDRSVTGYQTKR